MISTNYEKLYIEGEKRGSAIIELSSFHPITVKIIEYSVNLIGDVSVVINNNNTTSPSISVSYSNLYLNGETYYAILNVDDREDHLSIPIVINCSDTLIYLDVERKDGIDLTFSSLPEVKSLILTKGEDYVRVDHKLQIGEGKIRTASFSDSELFGGDYIIASNGLSQIAVDRDGQVVNLNKKDEAELFAFFPGDTYAEIIRADTDVSYIDIGLQNRNMIKECDLARSPLGFYQYRYKLPGYTNATLNVKLRFNPTTYRYAFSGTNITKIKTLPLPSKITDISGCFQCPRLNDISGVGNWDTSNVTKMEGTFNAHVLADISALYGWDTSKVTTIANLFNSAHKLEDISPLSYWNTSNVVDASGVFNSCTSLKDATPIENWNLKKAKSIFGMFFGCENLETVPYMEVPNVEDANVLFYGCSSLTHVGGFKGLKVSLDLSESPLLTHQSLINIITNLDTVYDYPSLILSSESLLSLNNDEILVAIHKGWNVEGFVDANIPQVEAFRYDLVEGRESLLYNNSYSVDRDFDVFVSGRLYPGGNKYKATTTGKHNVIYDFSESKYPLKSLFKNCITLQSVGEINRVIDGESLSEMFYGCYNLYYLTNLSKWSVSNVTDLSHMFNGCSRVVNASFMSDWDLSKLQNISYMFYGCSNLTTIPELDGTYIESEGCIDPFYRCSNLTTFGGIKNCKCSLDLSYSGGLTHTSLMNVINNLAVVENSPTLKLHTRSLEKLSDDEIMIAITKGWKVDGYVRKYDSISYELYIEDASVENVIIGYVDPTANVTVEHDYRNGDTLVNINSCIYVRDGKMYYKIPEYYLYLDNVHSIVKVNIVYMDNGCDPINGLFNGMYDSRFLSDVDNKTFKFTQLIPWNLKDTFHNANFSSLNDFNNLKVDNLVYAFGHDYADFKDHSLNINALSTWDTTHLTDMSGAFRCRTLIGEPLTLSGWKTDNVEDMSYTFFNCDLNGVESSLSTWNTGNVKNMSNLFNGAKFDFTSTDPDSPDTFNFLYDWNVGNVEDMDYMLANIEHSPYSPTSLRALMNWNTRNVRSMRGLFRGSWLTDFHRLSNWSTGNVEDMSEMFWAPGDREYSTTSFDFLSSWDTGNVKNMNAMFYGRDDLTTIPLLNTSSVTDMSEMFWGNGYLTSIPQFDTQNVKNMYGMFYSCWSLSSIPLLNTSSVTNMSYMFRGCYSLTTIPQLDTSSVTDMSYMFFGCYDRSKQSGITSIPELDCSNVTDAHMMFYDCLGLTEMGGLMDLKCDLSLTGTTKLTFESVSNIINKLGNVTNKTLTLHTNQFSMLTDELISTAINKGWILEEYEPGALVFNVYGRSYETGLYDPDVSYFANKKYGVDVIYKEAYGIDKVKASASIDVNVANNHSHHYTVYSANSLSNVLLRMRLTKYSYYYDYRWLFMNSGIKRFEDGLSIPVRGSGTYDLTSMFENCTYLESAPMIIFADKSNCTNMFSACNSMTKVPYMNFESVTNATGIFGGCTKLQILGGFGGLKVSLSLANSPLLTHSSLMNVINNLATVTDSPTLTLHADSRSQLTDAEIAIAINKGWTIN